MIALLCLFGGVSIASWNALDVLTVELYPSDKRCVGRWVQRLGFLLRGLGFEMQDFRSWVQGFGDLSARVLGAGCKDWVLGAQRWV